MYSKRYKKNFMKPKHYNYLWKKLGVYTQISSFLTAHKMYFYYIEIKYWPEISTNPRNDVGKMKSQQVGHFLQYGSCDTM